MTGADWIIFSAVVLLFILSVYLAVAETAFVRMNRVRAITLAEEGRKGADRLARMLEHPEQTLNAVLLLVLVSQLTSASLLGILLDRQSGPWGVAMGLGLQIVVFFVIGEVAPKTYAVQNTDRAALFVSGFLHAITVFGPLRILSSGLIRLANVLLPGEGLKAGPFVTEEDLRAMADVAADEQAIEREERRLIHSIFEFGDTVAREVMRPRPDMVAIEAGADVEEAIERAISAGYSRIPAYEETIDDIVGLVYLKDLVHRARQGGAKESIRNSMRRAVFVPETKQLTELLRDMQNRQYHMAIVVDEHGGTAGLVTLEDLLEEIVGEITDEYDVEEPGVERLSDGSLRLPGSLSIDDLSEELNTPLPDEEWDTVGGLVLKLMGRVPNPGESVRFQGFEFTTETVQNRRIASVLVTPLHTPESGAKRVTDGHMPS